MLNKAAKIVLQVPNVYADIFRSAKTRGWSHTLMQLYTFGDIRWGNLKGTDKFGNKFYEDPNAPWGQHRYVEYADIHNYDPTMIQPDWHGWMHHVFDEVPESHKFPDIDQTNTATNVPSQFKNHSYDSKVHTEFIVNKTQLRSRGYKIGSLHLGPDEEDQIYLPPGHCLSKLNEDKNKVRFDTYTNERLSREQEKDWLAIYNKK